MYGWKLIPNMEECILKSICLLNMRGHRISVVPTQLDL